jgi:hypothetical protein
VRASRRQKDAATRVGAANRAGAPDPVGAMTDPAPGAGVHGGLREWRRRADDEGPVHGAEAEVAVL